MMKVNIKKYNKTLVLRNSHKTETSGKKPGPLRAGREADCPRVTSPKEPHTTQCFKFGGPHKVNKQ